MTSTLGRTAIAAGLAAALPLALASCSGDDTIAGGTSDAGDAGAHADATSSADVATPSFSIVAPSSIAVPSGATVTVPLTVARSPTFTNAIDVSLQGLPSGALANGVQIPAGATVGALSLLASAGAPAGVVHARIVAKDAAGSLAESVPIDVVIGGAPGVLDATFGTGGKISFNVGASDDEARAIAMQPDGKLVVGGVSASGLSRAAIVRYDADGTLDLAFGESGVVTIPDASEVASLALQSDGKIVAALGDGFAIARFLSSGALDPSFHGNGRVTNAFADGGSARAVAIQPDGKIVVAGTAFQGDGNAFGVVRLDSQGNYDPTFDADGRAIVNVLASDFGQSVAVESVAGNALHIVVAGWGYRANGNNADFSVARLMASDGSLDPTFDGDGRANVDVSAADIGNAVAIQSDGKIVLAGQSTFGASGDDFTFVRLGTNGALDGTFGSGGIAHVAAASVALADGAQSIAIDPSGNIVATGLASTATTAAFAAVRLTPAGAADATFDGDGVLIVDFGGTNEAGFALAALANGALFVGGRSTHGADPDIAIARLAKDGSFDATFGSGGKVTSGIGRGDDALTALAITTDDKIVAVGSTFDGSAYQFLLARFLTSGALDPSFGSGGIVVTTFQSGANAFASGVAILSNGNILVGGTLNGSLAFAPYLPNGMLDATFGLDGKLTGSGQTVNALATYGDGHFVGGGGLGDAFALGAWDPTGAVLGTFGSQGKTTTTFGAQSHASIVSLALASDGKLIAFGGRHDYTTAENPEDLLLARYDGASGALDPAFGTNGIARTDTAAYESAGAIAIAGDGKIVALGTRDALGSTGSDFVLARYFGTSGALDPAFGKAGVAIADLGADDTGVALSIQKDGKILAGGSTTRGGDFALVRFTDSGAVDATFAESGILLTSFGPGSDGILAIARKSDGRIVVVGRASTARGDFDVALAQVWP